MSVRASALTVFVSLACGSAIADLTPLADLVQAGTEESYPLVRCPAFYGANLNWAGSQLNSEVTSVSQESMLALFYAAVAVRSEAASGTYSQVAEAVTQDSLSIADLYIAQYRIAYAKSGYAWKGNKLWEADAKVCKMLVEELFSQMRGGNQ